MIGVVFVRRLREGKTYADFVDAWYPETGFGVPARILSGSGVTAQNRSGALCAVRPCRA